MLRRLRCAHTSLRNPPRLARPKPNSQSKVLHSRRQLVRTRRQLVQLLLPGWLTPDFEMTSLANHHYPLLERGELAQFGRNQQAPGRIKLDLFRNADEQPLPQPDLRVETGEAHDPGADRLPRRRRIQQNTTMGMRSKHLLTGFS